MSDHQLMMQYVDPYMVGTDQTYYHENHMQVLHKREWKNLKPIKFTHIKRIKEADTPGQNKGGRHTRTEDRLLLMGNV